MDGIQKTVNLFLFVIKGNFAFKFKLLRECSAAIHLVGYRTFDCVIGGSVHHQL